MMLRVDRGKGDVDREVPLSQKLLEPRAEAPGGTTSKSRCATRSSIPPQFEYADCGFRLAYNAKSCAVRSGQF